MIQQLNNRNNQLALMKFKNQLKTHMILDTTHQRRQIRMMHLYTMCYRQNLNILNLILNMSHCYRLILVIIMMISHLNLIRNMNLLN